MYEAVVHDHFSSAHSLRGYRGKCEDLHGHTWKVAVQVSAATLDNLGMIIDFKVLKEELNKVIQPLDHKHLNELPPFTSVNPSSENIAGYIFQHLKQAINTGHVNLTKVTVWESEDSFATYSE